MPEQPSEQIVYVYPSPGPRSRLCVSPKGHLYYPARTETAYETEAEREYYQSGGLQRERLGCRTIIVHELGGLAAPPPEPALLVAGRALWGLAWRVATAFIAVWLGFCSLWLCFAVGGVAGRLSAVGAAILSCQLLFVLGRDR